MSESNLNVPEGYENAVAQMARPQRIQVGDYALAYVGNDQYQYLDESLSITLSRRCAAHPGADMLDHVFIEDGGASGEGTGATPEEAYSAAVSHLAKSVYWAKAVPYSLSANAYALKAVTRLTTVRAHVDSAIDHITRAFEEGATPDQVRARIEVGANAVGLAATACADAAVMLSYALVRR